MNGLYLLWYSIVILIAGMILFNIQGFQFKAIYTLNWLWICLTCNLLNLDLFDSYVIEFQLNQSSKSIISSSIKLAQGFQINPQIRSYITNLRIFLDSLMYFSFDKMLPTSHFMITIHVQFHIVESFFIALG